MHRAPPEEIPLDPEERGGPGGGDVAEPGVDAATLPEEEPLLPKSKRVALLDRVMKHAVLTKQSDLAKRIGVSEPTLSSWKQGGSGKRIGDSASRRIESSLRQLLPGQN